MKEKIKNIGRIFLNVVLVIVILVTIIIVCAFIKMKKNNNKYIDVFGYTAMQVITGSMADTININDIIIVKITDKVNTNDIISYHEENAIITHRIIDINGDTVITKGDANNSNDNAVKKENIIGKVIYVIPKVGIWKNILNTPLILIVIGVTICLIYVIDFSKDNGISKCIEKKE